jgi:phenylalanyl-tRNA synthetase beta subunit
MSVFRHLRSTTQAAQRRYLTRTKRIKEPVAARGAGDCSHLTLKAPGEGLPIFASRVIRGVKAGVQSPPWLRERLHPESGSTAFRPSSM